jgi:hypothetical protein
MLQRIVAHCRAAFLVLGHAARLATGVQLKFISYECAVCVGLSMQAIDVKLRLSNACGD